MPVPAEINPCSVVSQTEISVLEHIGLIYKSINGISMRPRPIAYRLLNDAGYEYDADTKPETKERVVKRRNLSALVLLTFYSAGISVFNDKLTKNINEPVYIASFAARRGDYGNPFGSTRFYGIFCTPQEAFLVLYADEIGVYYKKELTLFHNLTEITGIKNTALIIMGSSTSSIGEHVINAKKEHKRKEKYKTTPFTQILEISSIPVHFIPVGDAGAQILRFLLIPNYREEIAKAALMDIYRQPYEGFADTDAVHYKKPYYPAVVAVDMDVNRIDRAVAQAQVAGFDKIALYALKEQIPFLKSRYYDAGAAELLTISINKIRDGIKKDIDLYNPPIVPYATKEGRYFGVTDIAAYRKAGKQARQEDGPVSEPK